MQRFVETNFFERASKQFIYTALSKQLAAEHKVLWTWHAKIDTLNKLKYKDKNIK